MAKKEYDFRGKLFYVDPAWEYWLEHVEDVEYLKIWKAIMEYRLNGTEVDLSGEISGKAQGVYLCILATLARFDDDARAKSEIRSQAVSSRYGDKEEQSTNATKPTNATNEDFVEDDTNATKPTNEATIPYHTTPNHTEPKKENTLKSVKEKAGHNVFYPPTHDEVKNFMLDYVTRKAKEGITYSFEEVWAEDFMDFYGSKGWMVGSNKMKDWHLAASKWVRSQNDKPVKESQSQTQAQSQALKEQAEMFKYLPKGASDLYQYFYAMFISNNKCFFDKVKENLPTQEQFQSLVGKFGYETVEYTALAASFLSEGCPDLYSTLLKRCPEEKPIVDRYYGR